MLGSRSTLLITLALLVSDGRDLAAQVPEIQFLLADDPVFSNSPSFQPGSVSFDGFQGTVRTGATTGFGTNSTLRLQTPFPTRGHRVRVRMLSDIQGQVLLTNQASANAVLAPDSLCFCAFLNGEMILPFGVSDLSELRLQFSGAGANGAATYEFSVEVLNDDEPFGYRVARYEDRAILSATNEWSFWIIGVSTASVPTPFGNLLTDPLDFLPRHAEDFNFRELNGLRGVRLQLVQMFPLALSDIVWTIG